MQWQGNLIIRVCASTEEVSILISALYSHVLIVTQFKTCWQFNVIWWDSPPVSASTAFRVLLEGEGGWGSPMMIMIMMIMTFCPGVLSAGINRSSLHIQLI